MHPRIQKVKFLACAAAGLLLLGGCSAGDPAAFLSSGTRVIITTSLSEDQLFRIEDITCSPAEYMVCLINMQKTYEQGFSDSVWEGEEGAALAQSVRENALARIGRIKALTLLAAKQGIALNPAETESAVAAAQAYYETLTEADIRAMSDVDIDTVSAMVSDYMLADKVYRYMIRDIDPEISDDEARRVTVRQIVLRTWEYGEGGRKQAMTSADKKSVLQRAMLIRGEWESGTPFDELAAVYNESGETELSFGRDECDPVMEDVAFSLGLGEMSEPFETADGITMLYMINTYDRSETEQNKLRIMEERRHEAFDEEYDNFAASLSRTINEEIYDSLTLTSDPEVHTSDFFRYCEDVCGP